MKNITRHIICVILTTLFSVYSFEVFAQDFDQANVKSRVAERVQLMNDYVAYMADKKNDYPTRIYYRKRALPLFIGKGYKYISDGIEKEGVMMKTTSTSSVGKVTTQLIRD